MRCGFCPQKESVKLRAERREVWQLNRIKKEETVCDFFSRHVILNAIDRGKFKILLIFPPSGKFRYSANAYN